MAAVLPDGKHGRKSRTLRRQQLGGLAKSVTRRERHARRAIRRRGRMRRIRSPGAESRRQPRRGRAGCAIGPRGRTPPLGRPPGTLPRR